MRNMLLIARREYLEQIRGRAFRLSTIGFAGGVRGGAGGCVRFEPRPGRPSTSGHWPRTTRRWETTFANS